MTRRRSQLARELRRLSGRTRRPSRRYRVTLPDGAPGSTLEAALYHQLQATKLLDGLEREHRFHPTRRWLLDFAWPASKLGVEVHGDIWRKSGHTSGPGRLRDMEKMNEATLHGWRVLEVGEPHIRSGEALQWIERLLKLRKKR